MNEIGTAGTTAPAVTITLLMKYAGEVGLDDQPVVLQRRLGRRRERVRWK